MRYCRFQSDSTTAYAAIEDRAGTLWATRLLTPNEVPAEDLAATRLPGPFQPQPLSALPLLPPVTPSKILCIGRNYKDHAAELGNELPKEPLLFLKPPSSLLAPGGTILLPSLSSRVDYEGELAIVIGRRCRHLGPNEDVRPYIRGYTLVNDVTARDLQKSDGQWTRGKGFDTFCPTGPLVSNEIDPIEAPVTLTTRLNGKIVQQASTADLIFSIPHLLRYITAAITLEPGDLIPTGTPAGVGSLSPGDRIQVEIAGLSILENTAAAEENPAAL
ncbi:fumarylacetoacetate hydrolase family protein [Granulicella sp. dw_53]|uniref:fumarylacetoacetate hydrolase family protein n=1 Tax=Granulicella sp. dw_53 TaxID=2719792 RepID=UPI001BD412FB|nr:fumarylacetoacetate hydrolase family protein [Granulicella sp. dw_53]